MHSRKPRLVSFSGIDGAGKSTQIDALLRHLDDTGCRWTLRTFWDDVVAFSSSRERLSLKVFRGDKGVGSPDRPIVRRDKNVTSFHVVLLRLFLYLCDAIRLRRIVAKCMDQDVEFVIFDRYIYDELANLPLERWVMRAYARLLLRFAPHPDAALLLDADPESAHSRKPEYPLDFVRRNRESYLSIARMAQMSIVPPSPIPETTERIREIVSADSKPGPAAETVSVPCSPSVESARIPGS